MGRARKPPDDADRIRREILEHLDRHPPHKEGGEPAPRPRRRGRRRSDPLPAPGRPRLMLRGLGPEAALRALQSFVTAKRRLGVAELIVVVGKGRHSRDGRPVVGPAVRRWLDAHPLQVAGYEEAPAREGGAGALLVRLRPAGAGA